MRPDSGPTFVWSAPDIHSRDFTSRPPTALPRILLSSNAPVTVTVWTLRDPSGKETRCVLENSGGDIWELRLEGGEDVSSVERFPSAKTALSRADVIWLESLLNGWTEL